MNRTQENITKYKELIPGLKEKLAAAVLVFIMSAAMLVTSTFAWLTLSYSPQVQDVHTAVASNGNLEIALASGTITNSSAPGASTAEDGSRPLLERNLTWGNLINLSDPSYGLKELVLRPAVLNKSTLIDSPLYGPKYDSAGRLEGMFTNFGYSSYNGSAFVATDKLGIRAITSMELGETGESDKYVKKLESYNANHKSQTSKYEALADVEDNRTALASMMTGYLIENILKRSSTLQSILKNNKLQNKDLVKFASMYDYLIGIFKEEANIYADVVNLQVSVRDGINVEEGKKPDPFITGAEILALPYTKDGTTAYNALLQKMGGMNNISHPQKGIIKDLDNFLYDYNILITDVERIRYLAENVTGSVQWADSPKIEGTEKRMIDDIIQNLVNVDTCEIYDKNSNKYLMGGIGGSAASSLASNGPCTAVITNGILKRFEDRTGARLVTKDPLSLTAAGMTIKSYVKTDATQNYFQNEKDALQEAIKTKHGAFKFIAKDCYGFAVDFWVRTNTANSFLTLQGQLKSEERNEPVMGKDANGNVVDIYTITVKQKIEDSAEGGTDDSLLDELNTVTHDVYQAKDAEGNDIWYFASSHDPVTPETLGLKSGESIPEPRRKVNVVEYVTGFEGDNRVWDDEGDASINLTSTTQGSGSCYTFYSKSPVEQKQCLELLKAMRIAFVDDEGNLLTEAYMDTKRHYASVGKVVVPLALDSESINITDAEGKNRLAITGLEQNIAKRITAIVYIEGTNLNNKDVLASSEIEGQLNIQFGSSAALVPLNNEKLKDSQFYAEIENITQKSFDYDSLAEGEKMTTTVRIRATGTQPKTMVATVLRRLNDLHGTVDGTFELTDSDGDGIWEGDYTFEYPGKYVIRTVTVDGIERDLINLKDSDIIEVTGFVINNITYFQESFVMTDESSFKGNVSLEFKTDDKNKMPSKVVGKFVREDGSAVNVNFIYDAKSTWRGTAHFNDSGTYTMEYVVFDDQYIPLTKQKTVELILGMRVDIETTSAHTISLAGEVPEALDMQVKILDNGNNIVKNLAGASLYYGTNTNQLHTDLVYNATKGYYEGQFEVKLGTWKFREVIVERSDEISYIRQANSDAPVFSIISPYPPEFSKNEVSAGTTQYITDDQAYFEVTLLYDSNAAKPVVKLKNEVDGEEIFVQGYLPEDEPMTIADGEEEGFRPYKYRFDIPDSGIWVMKEVSVFDVYDSNSNPYFMPEDGVVDTQTEYDSGLIFDANDGFVETKVTVLYERDVKVSYDYDDSKLNVKNGIITFGKTGNEITGEFMESHVIPQAAIKATIYDDNNLIANGFFEVSDLSIVFSHGKINYEGSKTYGGYTGGVDNWNEPLATPLTFTKSADSGKFANDYVTALDFNYASEYVASNATCTINLPNGQALGQATLEKSLNNIEVYSKAPTVYISDITLDGTAAYAVDLFDTPGGSICDTYNRTTEGSGCDTKLRYDFTINSAHVFAADNTQYKSHIETNKLTAWLYFKCSHDKTSKTWVDYNLPTYTPHRYSYDNGNGVPAATLTLSGMGNATKAKLTFNEKNNGDVIMITEYTADQSGGTYWGDLSSKGTDSYEWTKDGAVKRYIGVMDNGAGENDSDTKTVAGTISANKLVLTFDGNDYTFTIPTITIHNKY